MATEIAFFPGNADVSISDVGGKGYSLIHMSRKGMPVPPGFVLTTSFFVDWFVELKKTSEWNDFVNSKDADISSICAKLKAKGASLALTAAQSEKLKSALLRFPEQNLFAVRSSSPEEDLDGFSFAGAYETVLGVKKDKIEEAISKSFASCLDYAIFTYKKQNELDPYDPKIAVVVQKQLKSQVAGVGFSLNPLSNDFDEAVITANFGLGESVVAGTVSPDTFIVDKNSKEIKSRNLGSKNLSVDLKDDGGTQEKQNAEANRKACLNDRQIRQVTDLVKKVEQILKKPVDTEWAFESDLLYLLQARPITAFQPIPPDMQTDADQARRLYVDATRIVQGIFDPLSVMGTSVLKTLIRHFGKKFYGVDIDKPDRALPYISSGHLYLNISTAMLFVHKEKLVKMVRVLDPRTADAIDGVSESQYKSRHYSSLLSPLNMISLLPGMLPAMLKARNNPEQAYTELQKAIDEYRNELDNLSAESLRPLQLMTKITESLEKLLTKRLAPCFLISRIAIEAVKEAAGEDHKELVETLIQSLPHNVTVEMGLDLYEVARQIPDKKTQKQLLKLIKDRSADSSFQTAWDKFIKTYGHRGPRELDIASPRYGDDPSFLVNQMMSLRSSDEANNPRARHERSANEREEAYKFIHEDLLAKDPKQAKELAKRYRMVESLGGLRETPKFCVILGLYALRKRLRAIADEFVSTNRLKESSQIFALTLNDVEEAIKNPKLDLQTLIQKHESLREKYRVASLPTVFDSRGRIIRPPAKEAGENEVIGMPISAGIRSGKVKVLHSPDEKPLLSGEVLVARATDPGWTPLFAAAGAVILEVGGVLQHGALVAREYGLPCVSGIDGATEIFKDGMEVEVNGSDGIVKILHQ